MTITYRRRLALPLLILLLAFALRLYRLDAQSIWWDEGHSIFVAAQPILQIPTLPAMDVHPPGYFALLHLWTNVAGTSEFSLRYLSVIFSLLTVAILWQFAARLQNLSLLPSTLVALFAALSPMYIAYAQEVRSYAMFTCFVAASTLTLWQLLAPPQKRSRLLLFYIILTAACLYIHYFTIFLLIFQNLVWLAWVVWQKVIRQMPPKRNLLLWIGSQIGILLLFLPQLLLAFRQVTGYTNPNLTPPGLTYFILRSWQAYTTGLTLNPAPARWGMGIIAVVLVISWIIYFWFSPGKRAMPFLFLTAWVVVPLAAYFIVLQRQPSFEPRYLILVTPALFLLFALGLGQVSRSSSLASRLTLSVLLSLTLLVLLTGLYNYYTNANYFKDDSAGVTDWLAAETTPNDIVYIDVPHPFHYYNSRIPAPTRYLFVNIHTAADILNQDAVGRDRLYWVTWTGSDTDPRGIISFLGEKAGQQLGRRDFRGYHVEWFSLPDDNTVFSLPTKLTPTNATFGDVLRLDGITYGNTTTVDNPAWATLHFTLLRHTNVDYKVSVRLRGKDGRLVSQVDRDLLNDRHFRTSAWPLDDPALNQALNVYTLPLAADTPPGDYQLEVVVYNSQPPYPSEGVSGPNSGNGAAAVIGPLTVTP
jgi:uncharacterized membrane protein